MGLLPVSAPDELDRLPLAELQALAYGDRAEEENAVMVLMLELLAEELPPAEFEVAAQDAFRRARWHALNAIRLASAARQTGDQ